jgi:hypothetical protein
MKPAGWREETGNARSRRDLVGVVSFLCCSRVVSHIEIGLGYQGEETKAMNRKLVNMTKI